MKRFLFIASGAITFTAAIFAILLEAAFIGCRLYTPMQMLPYIILTVIAGVCGAGTVVTHER